MKLFAIADLHLGHPANREALGRLAPHPEDWLIVAGDVGETEAHLDEAFAVLGQRFAKLIWVPGNHELWTTQRGGGALRGEAKYRALTELARAHGVVTPEDSYPRWPGDGRTVIVPMFLLYDYSFRPDEVAADQVLAWADGTICADEVLLDPDPYPTRPAWCAARVDATRERLARLPTDLATVLVNHFPLEQHHAHLPAIPRFSPWCGTSATAGWHRRFRARAVVYGHLHLRREFVEDGVRFHEVSLGYPRQWDQGKPLEAYLRRIL